VTRGGLPPFSAAEYARLRAAVDQLAARDGVDALVLFGTAGVQVGELVRIAVVDCSEHPKAERHHGLLVLVNPVIVAASGAEVGREGCLSIPELTANVRRATEVAVEATDPSGAPVRVEAEGFEARALQHELDHLDGLLFLDRVVAGDRVYRRRVYR